MLLIVNVISRKRLFALSFAAPCVTCFTSTTVTSCLCQVPGCQQRAQCCSRASLHAARRRSPSKSAGPKLARRRAERAAVKAQGITKPGNTQRKTRAARNVSNKIRLAEFILNICKYFILLLIEFLNHA
jgi:hypothetical protein